MWSLVIVNIGVMCAIPRPSLPTFIQRGGERRGKEREGERGEGRRERRGIKKGEKIDSRGTFRL